MDVCCGVLFFFFFKQNTAYEMRIRDWSSDVCSSDLPRLRCDRAGKRRNGARPRSQHATKKCYAALPELCGSAAAAIRLAALTTASRQATTILGCWPTQIGRASGRERVCPYVWISGVDVSLKKKK